MEQSKSGFLFKHVQSCSSIIKHVSACSSLFKHVQACSSMFKHVQASSSMFKLKLIFFSRDSWPTSVFAMRTWVVLCYITVFYTLIEYCLALALIKMPSNDSEALPLSSRKWGKRLEKISRIIAPLYLVLFNIVFFAVCLGNTYFPWKYS